MLAVQLSSLVVGLVLVCLTTQAGAGWFGSSGGSDQANFDALDAYLELQVDDVEFNSKLIRDNNLTGGARRAAELLVQLSKENKCNQNVLLALREAEAAGLKVNGPRRTQKMIRPHLWRLLKSCTAYLERNIEQKFNDSLANDKSLSKFLEIVGPAYFKVPGVTRDVSKHLYESLMDRDTYDIPSQLQLNQFLKKLSMGDPKAKFKEYVQGGHSEEQVVEHKDRFKYAFDRYLREPCTRFGASLAELFEGAKSVAAIEGGRYLFVEKRSPQFRCLAWTNEACRFVLNMNDADRAVMLQRSW